jgi:hypothetical protein
MAANYRRQTANLVAPVLGPIPPLAVPLFLEGRCAGDVVAWPGWLAGRGTGALAAGRVHVDLRAATQFGDGGDVAAVRELPLGSP